MSQIKRDIHGHTVYGEENTKEGMEYLDLDLDFEEAEIFFREARTRGQAKFEDDQDRDFTLTRNKDGTYTLTRRE